MNKNVPPFRAEIVGSFLRPAAIKHAREQHAAGAITAEQLRSVENDEISRVVALQRQHGLQVVTDGEFRRAWWHLDFFAALQGTEYYELEHGVQFNGVKTKAQGVRVVGKLAFRDHPMLEDFRYLQSVAGDAVAKMTIPSPSVLHFRGGREAIDPQVYPDLQDYFDDLVTTWRDAIQAFYDAGCRYLQLDDTVWAYLCSEEQKQQLREKGEDPEALMRIYAETLNKILADKPADLVVGMHVCRGNFRSTWIAAGGYEPVAEILFGTVNVDVFFLEYDNERSGGFEPLRFIKPGHQRVVLGLITTKNGELEEDAIVQQRLAEAAYFISLDQLSLSPQCGFASTEEGNSISEAQQWQKIDKVVSIARKVWPEA